MSTDALSLLTGRDVFTTGIIISRKPYYINSASREPRRIAYKLAFKTPHVIDYRGEKIPIYISALGKTDSWFTYRKLEKNKTRIGISGIRAATKLYTRRGGTENGYWIILTKDPPPTYILIE